MFNNIFNRDICVKMWINIVDPSRSQVTIWRMLIACWIPTVIKAHSEFVILVGFPLQQWLNERASMLRYTYSTRIVASY